MLKRQRPPSPPPSMPTIPLIVDPLLFDPEARHASKRRRVLPPLLDGRSRGWGAPDDEDYGDDEEHISNEDELVGGNGDRSAWTADSSEYTKANNVLHELHTLHQHRLLSSPLQPSNSHLSLTQHPSLHPPSSGVHRSDIQSKMITRQPQIKDPASDSLDSVYSGSHLSKDEVLRVTERYEDTNRLLGSLFLSRRRQLGAVDDQQTGRSS